MYWVRLVDRKGRPARKVFAFATYKDAWSYLEGWGLFDQATVTRE